MPDENAPDEPILIRIKAVPGASRDAIAGVLGDRLKVRISAPPEDGKANKAICSLLAKALGLKRAQVSVQSGHTNPEKTVRIIGCSIGQIGDRLGVEPGIIVLGE
jgi:uncharacterized protein